MKKFIDTLINESVIDVFVSGYIDSKTPAVFHPLYERLYFIFADKKFELYIDNDGMINSRAITDIELWFALDEDDMFSLMSVYAQLFKTEQQIAIIAVEQPTEPFGKLSFSCVEGAIAKTLFLDPKNFFGFAF